MYEDANARYSEIVRSVAADTGVDLCDVRAAFEPFSDGELAELLLPALDVLHLSAEGNRVYAEAIWPHVERAASTAIGRRRLLSTAKTATDLHWNERAASVADDVEVNVMDIFQREIEHDYICRYLERDWRILEVGCGNGFSTERFRALVEHVDAFDYAENMVERARTAFGETNNRFIHDNVLDPSTSTRATTPSSASGSLINLRDLDEQRLAIRKYARQTKSGGLLILAEGFTEASTR